LGQSNSTIDGGNGASHHPKPLHRGSKVARPPRPVLSADQSQDLRDRLLADLAGLSSVEAAAAWAHANISAKNSLTTSDADDVERAFQARLDAYERAEAQTGDDARASKANSKAIGNAGPRSTNKKKRTERIDKSLLAIPEPRRVRDRVHVKYVATHACLVCGRRPADAHHIRFAQRSALGRRVSDEFTVPLCRGHHRSLHRAGDEAKWWRAAGIDPMTSARDLWVETLVARDNWCRTIQAAR
jgi:hypothetical protein